MGGGLLGLEAARALQGHGLHVELVHAMPYLMNMQLDAEAGRDPQEERRVARDRRPPRRLRHRRASATDRVEGVGLADGRRIEADLLVVAAGVRPSTDIAVRSGLEVERGIVVDDQLRTDDPDVYAIGECAQHRGEVYGLVAPAWEHAEVLADVLTGTDPDAEYHGSRTATKLKVAGVDVAVMGINTPERDDDEFLVISEPKRGVHLSVVIRDDKLVGATLLGDTRKVAFLTQAFDRGRAAAGGAHPAAGRPLRRRRGGRRRGDARRLAGLQLQRRVQGRRSAARSPAAAAASARSWTRTRAGKGCGSCKSLVKQIVEWAADGDLTEDPAASWYVPGIPMAKPELMAAIREQDLRSASPPSSPRSRPGGSDDAKSKMGLTSLLKMLWGARLRPGEGRRVHQRPRPRQHPARRHVLRRPADEGRGDDAGAAAQDRRRRREVRGADGEDHRRPADRPARRPQGGPAGDVGRPRACRPATPTARACAR